MHRLLKPCVLAAFLGPLQSLKRALLLKISVFPYRYSMNENTLPDVRTGPIQQRHTARQDYFIVKFMRKTGASHGSKFFG